MSVAGYNPGLGIALKLGSVALFVVMSSLVKATSADIPPGEAVFFRSLFALPVILTWLAMRRELSTGLRTSNPRGHFWRGAIGTAGMALTFTGLGLLPLPEVTAIGYAAPLITVVLAAIMLGERLRAFRITAVIVGLVGVLIVLSPRLSIGSDDVASRAATLGAIVVLGAAAMRALAQIHVRRLVRTEETAAIVFWFAIMATCLSLLTLPFGWVMPTVWEALMLLSMGLVGGVSQILQTTAYRFAGAAVLAPFEYASMLFALIAGYFIFDESPTVIMLLGAAVVIAAGVLIIWRERQLGLEHSKDRAGRTP